MDVDMDTDIGVITCQRPEQRVSQTNEKDKDIDMDLDLRIDKDI